MSLRLSHEITPRERLALQLARLHFEEQSIIQLLDESPAMAYTSGLSGDDEISIQLSWTVSQDRRVPIRDIQKSLRDACELELVPHRKVAGAVLLRLTTHGMRLLLAPREPCWMVISQYAFDYEPSKRSFRGLPWRVLDSTDVPDPRNDRPLPLWLLIRASVGRTISLPRRQMSSSKRTSEQERQKLRRAQYDFRARMASVVDAFALLQHDVESQDTRAYAVGITSTLVVGEAGSGEREYEVVSGADPAWPERGLRLVLVGEGRRARCEIFRAPDSAFGWRLLGPPGLPSAVTLREERDDRYRHQRWHVNRLGSGRIHHGELAAIATQVRIASTSIDPSDQYIEVLPGEEPWERRQEEALQLGMSNVLVSAIKGPPGTGKSAVIVGLCRRAVQRGQRVLFVAPTHVAIDEVLRRVYLLREAGHESLVYPARVAPSDESHVDRRLLAFTPRRMVREIASAAQIRLADQIASQEEKQASEQMRDLVHELGLVRALVNALAHRGRAVAELEHQRREREELARKVQELLDACRDWRAQLADLDESLARSEPAGLLAHLRELISGAHAQRLHARETLANSLEIAEHRLRELRAEEPELSGQVQEKQDELHECEYVLARAKESCKENLGLVPYDPGALAEALEKDRRGLEVTLGVRGKHLALWARWQEFFRREESLNELEEWVLRGVNVVAATTQGIGGSPAFRSQYFDLVICDESSRVTRGELLTPACRGERVVLVGDEHQLPPYVESADEQLIQAHAVLDRSRVSDAPLPEAAKALVEEWNLGEPELRPLRSDQVCDRARAVSRTDGWPSLTSFSRPDLGHSERRRAWRVVANVLTRSCFDHALDVIPAEHTVRLDVQRRMAPAIAELVAEPVYDGDYRSPEQPAIQPLLTPTFVHPWMFIDTSLMCRAGRAHDEMKGTGFHNRGEADLVIKALAEHARTWEQRGAKPPSIMIIAFYLAQVRLIRDKLHPKLLNHVTVLPIDRCQGQEADIVVVSFVRSSAQPREGYGLWLQDPRRLNVAMTRARRSLIMVGNLDTLQRLSGNPDGQAIYRNLVRLIERDRRHLIQDFQ